MDRYRRQWEKLGARDPYWAVLSDPEKKGGKWDKDEFFESGRREIEQLTQNLARLGMDLRPGTALDFGCGVGRLCRALCARFERVIGIDVSSSMLDEARARHRDIANVEFVHNTAPDLGSIGAGSVDFVYSNIVLQHMPAPRQLRFIAEFCRVLRPGGIAVFQAPSGADLRTARGWLYALLGNRVLNVARGLVYGRDGVMEIHVVGQEAVLGALRRCGMTVMHVERYDATGKGFASFRYYAVKR